jgi:penicillin-insensitive murein endopeptidase
LWHGGLRAPACLLGVLGLLALPACAAAPPPVAPPPPPPAALPPPPAAPAPAPAPSAEPTAPAPSPTADADPSDDTDADDGDASDDDDDSADTGAAPSTTPTARPSNPLLALSDAEFQGRFKKDPASLGPMSVGRPNAGALVNGVNMPTSSKWTVLEPGLAWGTQETIDGLTKSIERVHTDFPGSAAIPIGHISSKHGGYLPVHKSHQAGRDVDVGYYFTTAQQYFVTGTKNNLDLARNLAFIKALLAVSDIEMIFIDTSIQKLLCDYAVAHGEDTAWLDRTFQVRQKQGVFAPIRHVHGHKNHLHIRFASPVAVALGRRAAGMVAIHAAPPPGTKGAPSAAPPPNEKLVAHKARSGDTLVVLAKRYGTTMEAIVRANGIKGTALKIGHVYQIPVPVPVTQKPTAIAKHGKKAKTGG